MQIYLSGERARGSEDLPSLDHDPDVHLDLELDPFPQNEKAIKKVRRTKEGLSPFFLAISRKRVREVVTAILRWHRCIDVTMYLGTYLPS